MSAPRPSRATAGPPARQTSADQLFRDEVARLRAAERRRLFPLGVNVGEPGGRRRGVELPWPVPGEYDAGLRFDVVNALVEGLVPEWSDGRAVWGWVVRPGVPQVHDCDLAWLAAVTHAVAAHGLPLAGFRAVTRTGWLDVVSGESRTWKRLRD